MNFSVPSTEHQQHAHDEAGVTDPVYDEGLLARIASGFLLEVETDQQVAAQSDTFPATNNSA